MNEAKEIVIKRSDGIIYLAVSFGVGMFISCFVSMFTFEAQNRKDFELEAVKKGHALYKFNEKYERVWEWLPPCEKKGQ